MKHRLTVGTALISKLVHSLHNPAKHACPVEPWRLSSSFQHLYTLRDKEKWIVPLVPEEVKHTLQMANSSRLGQKTCSLSIHVYHENCFFVLGEFTCFARSSSGEESNYRESPHIGTDFVQIVSI